MKVSILCAVYNEEKYIGETIQSVLAQSYSAWELIIVDDYSSDETFSIARKCSFLDSRIRVYRNGRNRGKVSAYNMAFKISTGDAICLLGGDDRLTPNSLENRVCIKNHESFWSDLSVTYGQVITFSEDKSLHGIRIPKQKNQARISGGSLMMSVSLGSMAFPIPESLPNEDTWLRIAIESFSNREEKITEIVLEYRQHSGNSHNRRMSFADAEKFIEQRFAAYELFYRRYSLEMTEESKARVRAKMELEKMRKTSNLVGLLRCVGPTVREKMSMLFYFNPIAYRFKQKYARYLIGR